MKTKVKAALLQTIKENDITSFINRSALWVRADRIGGVRTVADNLFIARVLSEVAWKEVLAAATAAIDRLNTAAMNAA